MRECRQRLQQMAAAAAAAADGGGEDGSMHCACCGHAAWRLLDAPSSEGGLQPLSPQQTCRSQADSLFRGLLCMLLFLGRRLAVVTLGLPALLLAPHVEQRWFGWWTVRLLGAWAAGMQIEIDG